MANIIRPAVRWKSYSAPPEVLLNHTEPGWEFRELDYAPGGVWDHVTIWLHIASHLDPLRQRLGPARAPFLLAAPSAAISAPGDHLVGAWEGRGRAQHIQISPRFIAAAMGPDLGSGALASRHFARVRAPDTRDEIAQHLMAALTLEIRTGNTSGPTFLETIVTALIQQALRTPVAISRVAKRGGLSSRQLRLVLDLIEIRLAERPSLLEFAAALDISTRYLCRAFRASTGISLHQFILRRRVEKARGLIEAGGLPLSEVAIAVGFVDHSQMSATFRKVLNAAPSHFYKNKTRRR
jgi:AraC-like DNA-binding protein